MRRLSVALPVIVLVVVAAASGRHALSAPHTARTLRVATFNIHKGADRQGGYNLDRTIEAIRHFDADLVGLQEVMRNHPDFNCDDQPALIAEGLRRRTGRPWTHIHVKAWITTNRYCLEHGRGSDVATEGLAFFTPEHILESSSIRLNEGRVGIAVRLESMPNVPVIVTHLAANREFQSDRIREISVLLPWAGRHGLGILMGDLNATPDATELGPVMARYRDAWADAAARGTAGGILSGSTRPSRRVSRVDYVLYEPIVDLALESAEVVDTSVLGLGEVSDHYPVVATFRWNPQRMTHSGSGPPEGGQYARTANPKSQ